MPQNPINQTKPNKPESVLEIETQKIHWDFEIQTDHLNSARRTDIVIRLFSIISRTLIGVCVCGGSYPSAEVQSVYSTAPKYLHHCCFYPNISADELFVLLSVSLFAMLFLFYCLRQTLRCLKIYFSNKFEKYCFEIIKSC